MFSGISGNGAAMITKKKKKSPTLIKDFFPVFFAFKLADDRQLLISDLYVLMLPLIQC